MTRTRALGQPGRRRGRALGRPADRVPPAQQRPGGILTFRGLYVAIYRFASRAAHGQPDSLTPYADSQAYPARVCRSEPAPDSIWWPLAVPLYAQALLVCHDHLGWPDPDRVRAINDAMYEQE